MGFDINKYDKRRFHEDELIHKRIKALLLWYEHQVYLQKFSKDEQVILLNNIVNVSIQEEWYEIATFFRDERLKILK
jgi:hypothetical protein